MATVMKVGTKGKPQVAVVDDKDLPESTDTYAKLAKENPKGLKKDVPKDVKKTKEAKEDNET